MKRTGLIIVLSIPVILAAIVAALIYTDPNSGSIFPGIEHQATGPCPSMRPQAPYVGVAPSGPWKQHLESFIKTTDVRPTLLVSYVPFGSQFDANRACAAARSGAMVMIQMNPRLVTLADIANGRYDNYLTSYATDVRKTGAPIVFSFAHEMNGHWYSWGYQNQPPKLFIKAWRHIHKVFGRAKATNVIWCWNINRPLEFGNPVVVPPRPWWPGNRYVDWVGIDAYYRHPGNTFRSVFGRTLKLIHKFTHKPVLIAETGAAPGVQEVRQIRSLFSGAKSHHLVGVVWFNINRKEDWQLEGRPDAIAAFRSGAKNYTSK